MPIRRSIDDIPVAVRLGQPPLTTGIVLDAVMRAWHEEYLASEHASRERAIPELPLRASDMGKRCDRALVYALSGEDKSNPPDAASLWRMCLGQLVHDEIDRAITTLPGFGGLDDEGRKHGWHPEAVVDLSVIGFPGSAHADLVRYMHGVPVKAVEVKTLSGFPFKAAATPFKGPAAGPRWDHVMQMAIVAVALGIPHFGVGYMSMEPISPQEASRMGVDEYHRMIAEWEFDTVDWEADVKREVARQKRLLGLAQSATLPDRVLSDPELDTDFEPVVYDVRKGAWQALNENGKVAASGTKWYCGYCDWRDRCIVDGPGVRAIGQGSLLGTEAPF